jgi:ABC-type multidrug transport system permease subunit
MKILSIVAKNFKLLVRSKTSAIVILLGPLLLVSLLGMAYSKSSSFSMTTAVYANGYTDLTYSLLDKLKSQNFEVKRYPTVETCTGAVKRGDAQACIQFPDSMKIEEGKTNEITFYVDYSQINLVWIILDAMNAGIESKSKEISKELTTSVVDKLSFVEDKLDEEKKKLEEIKTENNNINTGILGLKGKVAELNISVDFSSIDTVSGKDGADNVLAQFVSARDEIRESVTLGVNKTSSLRSDLSGLRGNVSLSLQPQVDSMISNVRSAEILLNETLVEMDSDLPLVNLSVISVKDNFDSINERLSKVQEYITDIRSKRDALLADFDQSSAAIVGVNGKVDEVAKLIDASLVELSALKIKDPSQISSPLTTKISPISVQRSHFSSLFPTLLILIIMITGILFAATLVIVEKKSRAFFRNSITPTGFATFALSTYFTSFIVLSIQLVLFISVSVFFFKTDVLKNVWEVLLLLSLAMTLFILIGMLIGFLFRSEETVTLAAITLISIFLLFSNAVIPLESLPAYLKGIASFNPFVLSETVLKQTILFSLSIETLQNQLLLLAGYGAGLFIVLLLLQDALRRLSYAHFWHFQFGEAKKAKVALTPKVTTVSHIVPVKVSVQTAQIDRKEAKNAEDYNKTAEVTPKTSSVDVFSLGKESSAKIKADNIAKTYVKTADSTLAAANKPQTDIRRFFK